MSAMVGKAHTGVRRTLTAVVGLAHLTLVLLGYYHRLYFTIDSRSEVLQRTVGNTFWLYLHGVVVLWIAFVLIRHKGYVPALSAAAGVLIGWGFLTLLWGLTTVRPVSLVGPVFVLLLSFVAFLLTRQWALHGDDH